MKEHWAEYGRNFFTRYDYEGCDADPCNLMMEVREQIMNLHMFLIEITTYIANTGINFSTVLSFVLFILKQFNLFLMRFALQNFAGILQRCHTHHGNIAIGILI